MEFFLKKATKQNNYSQPSKVFKINQKQTAFKTWLRNMTPTTGLVSSIHRKQKNTSYNNIIILLKC